MFFNLIKRRIVPCADTVRKRCANQPCLPAETLRNMAKKRKQNKTPYLIAGAMTILAAASVGLMFYSGGLHPNKAPEQTSAPQAAAPQQIVGEAADGFIRNRLELEYPLLPTEIPDVYVTADPYGAFTFYSYDSGVLTPCEGAQEKDVTVTCSHQQIPATLHYLQQGDTLTGYGLFRSNLTDQDVRLYAYAFFHLTNMPSGYGSGDSMLLVDFDPEDFAKADKTYSEVFSMSLPGGKTTRLTSDNGRTVDNLGRLRTDWAMMHPALLEFGGDHLYLSGRNYQLASDTADIVYNADTSNTKPRLVASGLYEDYLNAKGDALYYVKQAEQSVQICSLSREGQEKTLNTYPGDVASYLFSGDYMLEKNTLALTCVSTGVSKDLMSTVGALPGRPSLFGVSPDGSKLVILCDGETQSAILVDLAKNTAHVVQDKGLFAPACTQICWKSGSFLTIAEADSGYTLLSWSF